MTQGMVCHQTFRDKDGQWLFPTEVRREKEDWVTSKMPHLSPRAESKR